MKAQLAFLPADGIGQEVLREARQVLETIAHEHNHTFDWIGRIMDIQTTDPDTPTNSAAGENREAEEYTRMHAIGGSRRFADNRQPTYRALSRLFEATLSGAMRHPRISVSYLAARSARTTQDGAVCGGL